MSAWDNRTPPPLAGLGRDADQAPGAVCVEPRSAGGRRASPSTAGRGGASLPMAAAADAILAARRRLLDGGDVPQPIVPAPILRSWQRCAELGLTGRDLPRVEPLGTGALRDLHERHETLRRSTRPELETLRAAALRTDGAVILTDADGIILDMAGTPGFADRASRVLLRPGVAWDESVTGTNAIGTALFERRPITVHGAEHFFEPHSVLTCAAAPIVDPRGALCGVLDLSGHAAGRREHALELVRFAVAQIEHRFFDHGFEHCMVLRFHRDPALLGSAHEGILAFDGKRLVAANQPALRLLGLDWPALDVLRFEDLLGRTEPTEHARTLHTRAGATLVGTLSAPRAGVASLPPSARPVAAASAADIEPVLCPDTSESLKRAIRLLDANIPVLVCGETGTGKEVFARRMHAESSRRRKPFVAVNCAALPESLIEAELFGYEEGAFTGARRRGHKGLLRQADGGVLLLDEIGDMPLGLQARLLRVLQDRTVTPLGSAAAVPVDFAVICATHRSLGDMVAAGTFRQDLYFRIAPFVVELPPLRSLPGRGPVVQALWRRLGGEVPLPAEVVRCLEAYQWPGNFRQLVTMLRTLLVLAEPGKPVDMCALPAEIRVVPSGGSVTAVPEAPIASDGTVPLATVARTAMRSVLEASGGNVSLAARRLGINRSTLYRQLLHR